MYLEELNKINFPDYLKYTDINDAYSDFIGKVSSTIVQDYANEGNSDKK